MKSKICCSSAMTILSLIIPPNVQNLAWILNLPSGCSTTLFFKMINFRHFVTVDSILCTKMMDAFQGQRKKPQTTPLTVHIFFLISLWSKFLVTLYGFWFFINWLKTIEVSWLLLLSVHSLNFRHERDQQNPFFVVPEDH